MCPWKRRSWWPERGGSSEGYAYQNVGSITNRAWELQASAVRGRLSIAGTLALVDSRVKTLSEGYSGDLRGGDRLLAVPARTVSLSAEWTDRRWSASLAASRATDWVNSQLRPCRPHVLPGRTVSIGLRAAF